MSWPNYRGLSEGLEAALWERRWLANIYVWFTNEWWEYLLAPPAADAPSRWAAFRCRWLGHPNGTIYYNPGGYAPDDRCKDCYDDLG